MVLFGLLGAFLICVQAGLAALPNIEAVTVLIIIYTKFYRIKALIPVYVFVLVEGLLYGFGIWWISYLYVWAVLVFVCMALKRLDSAFFFALVAAIFGLAFGALTSIPYLFIGGTSMFVSTIVTGISFDITHCIGNFAITLALYRPLSKLFAALLKNGARGVR